MKETAPWYERWYNWWVSPQLGFAGGVVTCLALCAALPAPWSFWIVFWGFCELCWMVVQKELYLPRLVSHRPEDAYASPMTKADFERAVDNVVFMLAIDAPKYWERVTGRSVVRVPRSTARNLLKSLFFLYDSPREGSSWDAEAERQADAAAMLEHGLDRIEAACGGFAADEGCSPGRVSSMAAEVDSKIVGEDEDGAGCVWRREEDTCLIQGWHDDAHLASIVRSTPLVVAAGSLAINAMAGLLLRAAGWVPGPSNLHGSGLQCWVHHRRAPLCPLPRDTHHHCEGAGNGPVEDVGLENGEDDGGSSSGGVGIGGEGGSSAVSPPLVLIPGVGNGLVSFLPFALLLQRRLGHTRDLVLFRLPHVEVGRPWAFLPQWSQVVQGVLGSLHALRVHRCDLIAHSYGTAVANRVLRELCRVDRRAPPSSPPPTSSPAPGAAATAGGGVGGGAADVAGDPTANSGVVDYAAPETREASGSSVLLDTACSPPLHTPETTATAVDSASPAAKTTIVPPPPPLSSPVPPPPPVSPPSLVIGFLGLVDPIVLGGATCGLVGVINRHGPDLSFAFAANRAGVTHREVLDYDPTAFGQCCGYHGGDDDDSHHRGTHDATKPAGTELAPPPSSCSSSPSCSSVAGIGVYLSEGDILIDPRLAKHLLAKHLGGRGDDTKSPPHPPPSSSSSSSSWESKATCVVDDAPVSPHGRWLVELWCGGGGFLWSSPCASRCLSLLLGGIHHGRHHGCEKF